MSRALVFRPAARIDLLSIFEYIAAENRQGAERVLERILGQCESLRHFPELGRDRSDLKQGMRILYVDRRFSIGYVQSPATIEIIGVTYGGRDLEQLFRTR